MTAHDDDQDLVTIRIPRRAAALYAAELDVEASPWVIKVGLYARTAAGLLAIVIAGLLFVASLYQVSIANPEYATLFGAAAVICAAIGSFLFLYGKSQMTAARYRGLI